MDNILPFWRKPTNPGASTSTENIVTKKYNLVHNDNSTIGNQNFPSAKVVHMPITAGNDAVFNISYIAPETKKIFPVKYHILDLEESFRGRDDVLTDLKSLLLPDDAKNRKSTIVVISGLAGIGKTELARKFALKYENDFNGNILWISAETQSFLKDSFINIARFLKINQVQINDRKSILDSVYSYFENTSCLFVFDNAIQMRDIKDYLPSKSVHSNVKYSILITSTEKIWGHNIPVVTLNELPLDSAIDVAKAIIGETNCDSNTLLLNKIVEFVDRIPLGIQIISHLILNEIHNATEIEGTFSLTEFLKTLEDEMLLDEKFPQYSRNNYTKSIYIAIKLAIKKIEICSESGSIEALDVLHTIAYMCPDDIDIELLLLISVQPLLNKALAILSKFCLIRVKSDEIIIHRLVQKTICLYQEREHVQEKYINATLSILYDPLTAWKVPPIHRQYILKHKNCIKLCIDYYSSTKSQLFLYTLVEGGNEKVLSEIINNLTENEKNKLLSDPVLLEKATDRQDEGMVEFLLDHGASVQDNGSESPLIYALESENWDAAIVLIQNGCNVNARDVLGQPPLFILFVVLAGERTKPILDLLLARGADVFAKNDDQETLLHILAYDPVFKFIKYLCEKTELTKFINEKDVKGFTPLHRLFTEYIGGFNVDKLMEISEYLIQNGANPLLKTNDSETILHKASATASLKLVEYVIKLIPGVINEVDIQGKTALHKLMSSEENDIYKEEIAKFLIDNNSDLNLVDNKGKSILHAATKYFRPTILKYILEQGNNINVNKQDVDGYTILHNWLKLVETDDYPNRSNVMMENDCQELIEFILYLKDRSFDFHLKTKDNETLLHFAATKGNLRLLQTILEVTTNYDINAQDVMGYSVLHWLLHKTYYENSLVQVQSCFEYLISHGANINLINTNKQTILHLCAVVLDNKLIELILFDEMNFNQINSQDIDGNTALHKVCESNTIYTGLKYDANVECVKNLLDNGATINIQNNNNETPLHIAVKEKKYSLIKAITEHSNYNPNEINNSLDQMLFNLVKSFGKGSNFEQDAEQIKDFIKMGANINVMNENQETLLHITACSGNFKLIKFICEHKQYTNKINVQDNEGNTVLHSFLKNPVTSDPRLLKWDIHVENILKSIEYLVGSKKGDLTIKNNYLQTVLHFAVANNVLSIVKSIVETCKKYPGFNINDQDEAGDTVLHYLFRYKDTLPDAQDVFEQEFFAVLSYLLLNQANPAIVNKKKKTPSQLACENNLNIISRILYLNTAQESLLKKCVLM